MANLNKVMLIGRLTRDPEQIPVKASGGKGMKFGFAVNNRKKDQASGQWIEDPVFIDVEVWKPRRDTAARLTWWSRDSGRARRSSSKAICVWTSGSTKKTARTGRN